MSNKTNDFKQYTKELLKPVKTNFEKRKVQTFFNDDIWSADLVDYSKYSKVNKGFKYLLCIIDIYSRYVWVFPLKDKTSKSILDKFKTFKSFPNKLWVDQGSEFINKDFKEFCKSKGVSIYHTYGESKAVFIERFNRTLKRKISEYMIEENTNKYIDALENIVETYNNTEHKSTKEKPVDIYKNNKSSNDITIDTINTKPKYKVGDYVRISRVRGIFDKGYKPKWSKEVFKIIDVSLLNPVMYQLEDLLKEKIDGKFYEEELQKTDLKDFAMIEKVVRTKTNNGVKQYLVKYDGYDDKFNEWINEDKLEKRKK